MPKVSFVAAERGVKTTRVRVDEKVLHLGGEPVEVTKRQLERLRALPGLRFQVQKDEQQDS